MLMFILVVFPQTFSVVWSISFSKRNSLDGAGLCALIYVFHSVSPLFSWPLHLYPCEELSSPMLESRSTIIVFSVATINGLGVVVGGGVDIGYSTW